MLYSLVFVDLELCYDNYEEAFFIGVFESEQEAKDIAKFYLTSVPGFCEYSCNYRIKEKELNQDFDSAGQKNIWIASGWNVNKNGDEIDIIEGKCYSSKKKAVMNLKEMKSSQQRMEWSLDRYKVGELLWREGFARVTCDC